MDIQHDDGFIGKFVQVVGHMQILETRNTMLSMHIVEPAFNSLDGFDHIAKELLNSQSSNNEINKQLQIPKKKPLSYTHALLISSVPKNSSLKIKDR